MKKLMFSALACVAFAFSGFASNEVVNEQYKTSLFKIEFSGECQYSITLVYTGSDGKTYKEDKTFKVPAKDADDCATKANNHLAQLNKGLVKW